MMTLVTLRDDLGEINRALVDAEICRDRVKQAEQLERAIRTSARAIEGFLKESELAATLAAAGEAAAPYQDAIALTREDAMLFQAFLEAEGRLFRDLGLDGSTCDRLIAAMREMQAEPDWQFPSSTMVDHGLRALAQELSGALEQLERDEDHRATLSIVRRGFLVVGGAFVVGANALVGAATAPVTGGLSIAGAAVSASVGGVMVDRGFPG
jgi:hypothetical protein